MADPYRTEAERPMSELTRDKLLLALADAACAIGLERLRTTLHALNRLAEQAKKEMGIE